jgi:hypothetical protein
MSTDILPPDRPNRPTRRRQVRVDAGRPVCLPRALARAAPPASGRSGSRTAGAGGGTNPSRTPSSCCGQPWPRSSAAPGTLLPMARGAHSLRRTFACLYVKGNVGDLAGRLQALMRQLINRHYRLVSVPLAGGPGRPARPGVRAGGTAGCGSRVGREAMTTEWEARKAEAMPAAAAVAHASRITGAIRRVTDAGPGFIGSPRGWPPATPRRPE